MIRVLLIWLLLAIPSGAVEPDEMLADPALEERARALGDEVRCLVCRSESVEGSNSDFARDLRLVIRERVAAGDNDAEVLDYLAQRFGDYIRLKPRFGGPTVLLWLIGPLLLIFGVGIAVLTLRRRGQQGGALSSEEEQRLAQLMDEDHRQ